MLRPPQFEEANHPVSMLRTRGREVAGDRSCGKICTVNKEPTYSYGAFISYRHVRPDSDIARWLHRTLERYVPPKAIRGKAGVRSRVGVVFRDEEELSAAAKLSEAIHGALGQSRFLVVVCSPRTRESKWVDAEVSRFRELGREDRILALLIEGEPHESFPDALRTLRMGEGNLPASRLFDEAEPLAADLRPRPGEGRRTVFDTARLKLLAPLLGCSYTDLRQRDQEYRTRRAMAVAAGSLVLVLLFAGLAVLSYTLYRREWQARQSALAHELAAQSQLVSAQNPAEQEASVVLAVEGMRRLHSLGQRSVQTDRAVRRALDLQPWLRQRIVMAGGIRALRVSPSGRFLAVESAVWGTRLLATGQVAPFVELPITNAMAAAFATGEAQFAITDGRDVWRVDLVRREATRAAVDIRGSTAAAFATDAQSVAALHLGNHPAGTRHEASIALWEVPTGRCLAREHLGPDWVETSTRLRSKAPPPLVAGIDEMLARAFYRHLATSEEYAIRQHLTAPGGQYLLTSGFVEEACQILLWHPSRSGPFARYGTGEVLPRIACSPDGLRIALAVQDGVRLAAVPERHSADPAWLTVTQQFRTEAPVEHLAFSGNGRWLVTVVQGTARAWEIDTGRERFRAVHDQPVRLAQWDGSGNELVTVAGEMISVWSVGTPNPEASSEGFRVDGALHPGGEWIARVRRGGIEVIRRADDTAVAVLPPADAGAQELLWSDDGSLLAAGRDGVPVRIWRWPSAAVLGSGRDWPTGQPLAFGADRRFLAVGDGRQVIRMIDLSRGVEVGRVNVPFAHGVAVGEGGRHLVWRDSGGVPRVWSLPEGKALNPDDRVAAIALVEGAGTVASWSDGVILTRNLGDGAEVSRIPLAAAPRCLAVGHAGRVVAAAADRVVRVWTTAGGTPTREWTVDLPVDDLVFAPGEPVVATLHRRLLQLWDYLRNTEIARLPVDPAWYEDPGSRTRIRFLARAGMVALQDDHAVRCWFWRPPELMPAAHAALVRPWLTREEWWTYLGGREPDFDFPRTPR